MSLGRKPLSDDGVARRRLVERLVLDQASFNRPEHGLKLLAIAREYESLEDVTLTFRLPQAQPLSGTFGPAPFLSQLRALRRINIIVDCKDRSAHAELEQHFWNMLSPRPDLVASIVITGEPLSHLPDGLRHFTSLAHLQVSLDWWGKSTQGALLVAALGMCRS